MLTDRLQILIRPDQRQRLEAEAKRRETSVAAVIREAVDEKLGGSSRAKKMEAVAHIRAMNGGIDLPPEELKRVIDDGRLEEALQGLNVEPQ